MRWKLLYAVSIVSLGLLPSLGFGAESNKRSGPDLYTVVAHDEQLGLNQNPSLDDVRPLREQSRTERGAAKLTLRDLFLPTQDAAKTSQQKADSINVEPWMPMRGALGVKVEVTW